MRHQKNNNVLYFHVKENTGEIFYVGIGNNKRPYNKRGRSEFHSGRVRGARSNEAKAKISLSKIGKKRKPFSEEHKKKISETMKLRKQCK